MTNIENVTVQFYDFRAFWEIETVTDPKHILIQASWENLCDIQPRSVEFAALTSSLVTSDPLYETISPHTGVSKSGYAS